MKAEWHSNAPTVRARFDAAVPEGLRIMATAYEHHLKLGLTAMFPTESRWGRIADSIKISKVGGTGRFRIRVYSRHHLARFWELGWRHWTQGRKARLKKNRGRRLYDPKHRGYRRAVWRPVLYSQLGTYRKMFRHFMEGRIGRPMTFED